MPVKIVERRHFNPNDGSISVAAGSPAGTGAAGDPAVALQPAAGVASGTGAALAATVSVANGILYGFNIGASKFGFSETLKQAHDRYLSSFNLSVVPIAKMFTGSGIPAAWSSTNHGVVSGRRVIICYRPKTTVANAAAGDMDADVDAFFRSVPRDWYGLGVFWQEADDDIKAGAFTAADYQAVYARHYPIIKAAQKAPSGGLRGNKLEMWSCFQGPFASGITAQQSADWLPDPANCDGYGWDLYGNPHGVGGSRYDSLYDPPYSDRFQTALDATNLRSMTRWGVMELGAPWRNWDTGAATRNTYLTTALSWLEGRSPKPEFLLCFDALGNKWDQRVVADGLPTQFDHGSDVPRYVNVPVTPDEPFQATFEARIKGGIYNQFLGPS